MYNFFIMYFSLPRSIPPHPLGGIRVRKHWHAVYYFISYYSTTLLAYPVMITVCLYWYDLQQTSSYYTVMFPEATSYQSLCT
jgi:hypothetical protein